MVNEFLRGMAVVQILIERHGDGTFRLADTDDVEAWTPPQVEQVQVGRLSDGQIWRNRRRGDTELYHNRFTP